MDLRHLRYFVAVAEEENIGRAAARLHISQPPLTRQIQQLEEELGVPIFERLPRGVRLSTAGELLVTHLRRYRRDLVLVVLFQTVQTIAALLLPETRGRDLHQS